MSLGPNTNIFLESSGRTQDQLAEFQGKCKGGSKFIKTSGGLQENIDSTSKQQLSIVNRISGELQVNLRKLQKTNKKAGADAPGTRKDGILTSV